MELNSFSENLGEESRVIHFLYRFSDTCGKYERKMYTSL